MTRGSVSRTPPPGTKVAAVAAVAAAAKKAEETAQIAQKATEMDAMTLQATAATASASSGQDRDGTATPKTEEHELVVTQSTQQYTQPYIAEYLSADGPIAGPALGGTPGSSGLGGSRLRPSAFLPSAGQGAQQQPQVQPATAAAPSLGMSSAQAVQEARRAQQLLQQSPFGQPVQPSGQAAASPFAAPAAQQSVQGLPTSAAAVRAARTLLAGASSLQQGGGQAFGGQFGTKFGGKGKQESEWKGQGFKGKGQFSAGHRPAALSWKGRGMNERGMKGKGFRGGKSFEEHFEEDFGPEDYCGEFDDDYSFDDLGGDLDVDEYGQQQEVQQDGWTLVTRKGKGRGRAGGVPQRVERAAGGRGLRKGGPRVFAQGGFAAPPWAKGAQPRPRARRGQQWP